MNEKQKKNVTTREEKKQAAIELKNLWYIGLFQCSKDYITHNSYQVR